MKRRAAYAARSLGTASLMALALPNPVAVAQPQPSPADDAVSRGRELYVRTGCYACHGYAGQGGLAGPRLAPDPLPVAAFTVYLRRPGGVMPPYAASVLGDAKVADIHAYVASLPPPPPLESIPLLRDDR